MGLAASMTNAEKEACRKLEVNNTNNLPIDESKDEHINFAQRIENFKKRKLNQTNKYGNCDFIFGSAAVVERLWSVGTNILED